MAYSEYTAITTTRTRAKEINLVEVITPLLLLPSLPLLLIISSYINTNDENNNNNDYKKNNYNNNNNIH